MPSLRTVGIDYLDTAPTRVSTEVDIEGSLDEVWTALLDNSSWPEWFGSGGSVTASPPVWSSVGDTRSIRVGPMTVDEVAIDVRDRERWAMCLTETNVPLAKAMIEVVDLRDTSRDGEQRTELRWTMAAEPYRLLGPIWPRIQGRMSAMWLQSLENLHTYLAERR